MKIYTGYYNKHKKYLEDNLICLSISLGSPIKCFKLWKLVPSKTLLSSYKNKEITEETYKEIYIKENLIDLELNRFLKELELISEGKDVVLMCYEAPNKFCHRHLVAEFLNKNNIKCEEYKT